MYRSILVPLDGSSFGEGALPLALSIARRADATLQIVHVHDVGTPRLHGRALPVDVELNARNYAAAQLYLTNITRRLATMWDGAVTTALLEGHVAETLLDHITTSGADLVVMTTHGRGGFSRLFLGNTADRVMRHAPVPVLLARPNETVADHSRSPVFAHMLIPLDGSALAEQVLAPALALGRLMDAEYTLLQTVNPIIAGAGPEAYALTEQALDQWLTSSQTYLDGVATRLRAEGFRVKTEVAIGAPALAILDYASIHDIDIIAMATHGRSGVSRLFLGSVADKVVRSADMPILLNRPEDASRPANF